MSRQAISDHNPDIFTIICLNDAFQLALDHATIAALLQVCKRAKPFLSSRVARFRTWCQTAELCRPDGQLRIGLTPSDQIALSLRYDDQDITDRSWLASEAYRDNPTASYFLAWVIETNGRNWGPFKQHIKEQQIFRWFKDAARTGHPMAQFRLAGYYYQGRGVGQSHTKAVELYRTLADRGISQAQVALGCCYEKGEGVERDFDAAIEWYSKAADQGNNDARVRMVFLWGWISFIGFGAPQSDISAFSHWQEVSESTDPVLKPIATHMVGWMHYLGRGTVQNKRKGIAIIRNNKSDRFKLGEHECLSMRYTEPQAESDALVAREFFELCRLGSERDWVCKHLMAVCLINGFGIPSDAYQATKMFEQLASDGHSPSQFWAGICYVMCWGVRMNSRKAFEWFSKSAAQGDSYGQWLLGRCYHYYGHGVAVDETKAFEWYRESAEQGNRYGQYWLGVCYRDGVGVAGDSDTAIAWFRKSADQGFQWAVNRLGELCD